MSSLDKEIDEIIDDFDTRFVESEIGNSHDSYPYGINKLAREAMTDYLKEVRTQLKSLIADEKAKSYKKGLEDAKV